jgi:tetratricopeptide (TPR) repeat protein
MYIIANRRARFLCNTAVILIAISLIFYAKADTTNAPAPSATDPKPEEAAASQESLRSYLQIQEQLHNTQLALEKYHQVAEAAAASNSQEVSQRLSAMQTILDSQRLENMTAREHSYHLTLVASGVFAAVGFVVLLIAAFLQLTAVNRLAAAAATFASHSAHGMALGESQLLPSHALQQSTASFLGIIERLEQRIHDLESATAAKLVPALPENGSTENGAKAEAHENGGNGKASEVSTLISKVQTLLKLDKPEAALTCLDELLVLDPSNADALVKKGAALERLQRFDEAIQYYDRAIAQDNSMTMAYLYKGGVYNRLERYSEALACYEQALKTRQKGHAANVIME